MSVVCIGRGSVYVGGLYRTVVCKMVVCWSVARRMAGGVEVYVMSRRLMLVGLFFLGVTNLSFNF